MAAYKAIAPIPIAFALASVLLRIVLPGAPKSVSPALAQPLPVVTGWHDFGVLLWCCTFAAIIAAAIAYVRWLRYLGTEREPARSRAFAVLALSAAALAAALSFPVIFSSDVYAYAAYGWLAHHGIDPYSHARIAVHDPLITAAVWQWNNPLPVCAYGPAFIWLAKVAVSLSSAFGPAAQLLAIRILCALALLLCAPLLAALFDDPRRRELAIAGVLLNPLAIWCAAEGHNDTILLASVLLGLLVLKRFGHLAGAFALMTTALIKASGMAAAFALAIFAWPHRARFLRTLAGIVTGGALVAVLSRPFETTIATSLVPHGRYLPQYSLQYLVAQAATAGFGAHVHAIELAVAIALVCAGSLVYRGARLAFAGDVQGAGFLALALWLVIPNPYPWYALWILPVAFLAFEQRVSWAIVAASITIFARYLPDSSSAAHWERNVAVTLFALGTPWLVALWPFDKLRVTTNELFALRRTGYVSVPRGTSADARKRTGLPIR